MKHILVLSSTPVKGGNSELLCKAFADGAAEAGHQVELIPLREKEIHFCRGCEACVKTGKGCVQKDDMAALIEKAIQADVLVFGTPIYFMSVSAQLKVFFDRFIAGENSVRSSSGKKAYLLTAAAAPAGEENHRNHMAANESFRGFLRCLRRVEEGGILNAGGAYAPGEIEGTKWLEEAKEMGKSV